MMIPSYQISLAHRESRTEYIKTLHISPSAGNRGLGGTRNYHKYQIGNVIWNIFQVTPLEGKYILSDWEGTQCRLRLRTGEKHFSFCQNSDLRPETWDPTQHNTFLVLDFLLAWPGLTVFDILYVQHYRSILTAIASCQTWTLFVMVYILRNTR